MVHKFSVDTSRLLMAAVFAAMLFAGIPAAAVKPVVQQKPDRLLFRWENAKKPVIVNDYDGKPVFARFFAPVARGLAVYDHNYAMWLHGGAYTTEGVDTPMADAFRKSSQFGMEITLTPTVDGVHVAMASASGQNMLLSQVKNMLVVQLNTGKAIKNVIPICPVVNNESCHLIISYKPGELNCYKNGKLILAKLNIKGNLSGWTNQPLIFGNDNSFEHSDYGKLEGISIYAREITAGDVQQKYAAYLKKMQQRKKIPQLIVQAKLVQCSDIQTPQQILPYTQALAMYEYEVEKVISGTYTVQKIRAAHWVVLDKKILAAASRPINKSYRLTLEPFEDNPQLEASLMNDTLPFDVETGQYFDINSPGYVK